MIKYAYLHLNFEDDVIVGNLFCFCCALFTASEKSRRKEPTQPPLSKITPTPAAQNTDVNLATNFTAIAYVAGQNSAQGTNGVVSGSVTATYNGQSYTGNLTDGNAKDTTIYSASDKKAVDVSSSAFAATL